MTHYGLDGKVVLITGATGGIGAATTRAVLDRGAAVVLVDLGRAQLDDLAASLDPDRVLTCAADVTSLEQMTDVAAQAISRFGRIDVVFANAGIAADPPVTVASSSPESYERVIEVDLLGVYRTVKPCLDEVIRNGGYVLITASIYAFMNGIANSPYAMSKAGIEGFGRALRAELAHTDATAGVLYPGWVDTPIAAVAHGGNATATAMIQRAFRGPLGRTVSAGRIADATVRGIERRAPRIIEPRLWVPFSLLRGVVSAATDLWLDRDRPMMSLVRELEEQTR